MKNVFLNNSSLKKVKVKSCQSFRFEYMLLYRKLFQGIADMAINNRIKYIMYISNLNTRRLNSMTRGL